MGASHERAAGAGITPGEPADADLVRRVQAGERWAFELLARRYLRPIHSVAASLLRDPADIEDAAQETFLRALDRIHTFDPARPFAPWLYQVARNVARNRTKWLRRRRTHPLAEIAEAAPSDDPAPSTRVARAELRALLAQAIDGLPEQQRTAFRLAELEGYSASEIAQLMGLSAGTVRSHVHHARRALRARLAPMLKDRDENHG